MQLSLLALPVLDLLALNTFPAFFVSLCVTFEVDFFQMQRKGADCAALWSAEIFLKLILRLEYLHRAGNSTQLESCT